MASLLPHEQALDFPFLAQVFRRHAQSNTRRENRASRVDSCRATSRVKEYRVGSCLPPFWGSNRMELPHYLQALYGAFGSQEHPSSGNQDPSPPPGLLEKEEFYPERAEPQKGYVTGTGGRERKEALARDPLICRSAALNCISQAGI